ncbi:hypothetical protein [Archangium lipolyticum]|uniref:hypothetical protein n=1 Tax=Archangium lipolyticum TaxID=2970465 RepID=UPI002149A216|nr:hypothetical protein [Archangium lipolyticum]
MLTTLLYATLLGTAPVSTSSQETGSAPTVQIASASPMRARAPLMAGIGASMALTGTVFWIIGNVQQGTAAPTSQIPAEIHPSMRAAQQYQLGGMALTLVGACAVGVAAVMWSWTPERPGAVSASVMVAPHGGGVSLTGTFP